MAVTAAGAVVRHERKKAAKRKAAALPRAPSPRPAQGFSSARAQRWVLGAALIVAMTYTFRRLIEGSVAATSASGGTVASLVGTGKPPPALGQWAIAYGAGFTLLSILTLGAPEVAASVAALTVVGSLLANGTAIVADIKQLEGQTPATASPSPVTAATGLTGSVYAGPPLVPGQTPTTGAPRVGAPGPTGPVP